MSDAGEIIARLKLDGSDFLAELDQAKASAEGLNGIDPKITVKADTAAAIGQLNAVKGAADGVAAAETRVAAARSMWERATNQATIAEMRLDAARKNSKASAVQVATATEAYRFANEKATTADGRLAAAETALAEARKKGTEAAVEEAAASDEAGKKATASQKPFSLLAATIATLGPGLIPLSAAAVGVAGALGGMGAAGVLAVLGIKRAMDDGTTAGLAYKASLSTLQTNLHQLEDTAATGLLPGFQAAFGVIERAMPGINTEVGTLTAQLGRMLPSAVDTVITMFTRLEPVINASAGYLVRFVAGLDGFAHSRAFGDFVAYALQSLPSFEQLLQNVLVTAGDFLAAMAPYGSTVVTILNGILPMVQALSPLAPEIWAVWTAFSLWRGISPILDSVTGALGRVGGKAVVTTGELEGVAAAEKGVTTGAAGFGGVALGLGAIAAAAEAAAYWTSKVNYDKTYKDTKGSPAKKAAVAQTAQQASVTAPDSAGGGGNSGVGMAIGNSIDAQWEAEQAASKRTAAQVAADQARIRQAATNTGAAWRAQVAAVNAAGTAYSSLVAKANGLSAAEEKAGKAAQTVEASNEAVSASVDAVSASFKTNGATLSEDTAKGVANRQAVLQSVQAIQAQGDALVQSGKSALDARISNDTMAISLEKTMEKFGVSKKAAEAYVNQLLGIPKNVSTVADLKNALALQHAAAAKKAAQAFADGDYTAALKADSSNMKSKVANAQKVATEMAQANYTASLKANPNNANVNTADAARKAHAFATGAYTAAIRANASQAVAEAARAKAALDSVRSRQVYLTVYESVKGNTNAAQIAMNAARYGAHGGTAGSSSFGSVAPGMAYGGTPGFTVRGPGNAASDQAGQYRLANGEEVTSNLVGQADRYRRALKAINANKSPKDIAAALGASGSGPTTVINRTIAPEIHIHNPVAVDPVQQVTDATQYALAYAGIG